MELRFHKLFVRNQPGRSNVYKYISSRLYHAKLGKCDKLRHWNKFVLLLFWSIQTSFLIENFQQWPIAGIKVGINILSLLNCECQIRAGLIVQHIAVNLPQFTGCQHAGGWCLLTGMRNWTRLPGEGISIGVLLLLVKKSARLPIEYSTGEVLQSGLQASESCSRENRSDRDQCPEHDDWCQFQDNDSPTKALLVSEGKGGR